MKPTAFDIGDKVFVVLCPGMYEGQSPGVDPSNPYIFEMRVGGLRWDASIDDWWYEVYSAMGNFWTLREYLHDDQRAAVRTMGNIATKRDGIMRVDRYVGEFKGAPRK